MSESLNTRPKPQRPSLRKLHGFKDKNQEEGGRKLQMSFGGCGFLGVYHVGVGKCVVDHAPHLFSEFDAFYGASAGAITAVCAACKSNPMVPYMWVKQTFEDSRNHWFGMLSPNFDLYDRLRKFLEDFLPQNAHTLCKNVVKISLSVFGDKGLPVNWLVTDFRTRRELINIIIASSFIPVYAGFKSFPVIRGRRCFDGGFTSNIPCVGDPEVITVTPFAGFCDICPQGESQTQHMINLCDQPMLLSPKNLHRLAKSLCPTSWEELEDLYHQGYSDCLAFLRKEGLVPNPVIQKRTSSMTSTSSSLCSIPRNGSCHTRMTSLTLSSSGEFLSCLSDSERCSSVSSLPLEEVEMGLDLRGTEKANHVTMRYGRRASQVDFFSGKFSRYSEGERGVISRVIHQPMRLAKSSWNSLNWLFSSSRDSVEPVREETQLQDISEEEPPSHEDGGMFGVIAANYPSSMLTLF